MGCPQMSERLSSSRRGRCPRSIPGGEAHFDAFWRTSSMWYAVRACFMTNWLTCHDRPFSRRRSCTLASIVNWVELAAARVLGRPTALEQRVRVLRGPVGVSGRDDRMSASRLSPDLVRRERHRLKNAHGSTARMTTGSIPSATRSSGLNLGFEELGCRQVEMVRYPRSFS